jgi:hypothetical protein
LKSAYEADLNVFNSFDVDKAKADYAKTLERWNEQAAKAKAEGNKPPAKPNDPADARSTRPSRRAKGDDFDNYPTAKGKK